MPPVLVALCSKMIVKSFTKSELIERGIRPDLADVLADHKGDHSGRCEVLPDGDRAKVIPET